MTRDSAGGTPPVRGTGTLGKPTLSAEFRAKLMDESGPYGIDRTTMELLFPYTH